MGPAFLRIGVLLLGLCALGLLCSTTANASTEYSTIENVTDIQMVEGGTILLEAGLHDTAEAFYTSLPCADGSCAVARPVRSGVKAVGAVLAGKPVRRLAGGVFQKSKGTLKAVGQRVRHPFAGARAKVRGRRC